MTLSWLMTHPSHWYHFVTCCCSVHPPLPFLQKPFPNKLWKEAKNRAKTLKNITWHFAPFLPLVPPPQVCHVLFEWPTNIKHYFVYLPNLISFFLFCLSLLRRLYLLNIFVVVINIKNGSQVVVEYSPLPLSKNKLMNSSTSHLAGSIKVMG